MTPITSGPFLLLAAAPPECGCLDRELVWLTSVGRSNDIYVATSLSSPMTPFLSSSSYSVRILFP